MPLSKCVFHDVSGFTNKREYWYVDTDEAVFRANSLDEVMKHWYVFRCMNTGDKYKAILVGYVGASI